MQVIPKSVTVDLPIPQVRVQKLGLLVRYSYYLFVFFIPFEVIELFSGSSLSSLAGKILVMMSFLKPRMCYKRLHPALWLFTIYLAVYVCFGLVAIIGLPDQDGYLSTLQTVSLTMIQLLVFFWISSNLLADARIARGALFSFATGCVVVAIVQLAGLAGTSVAADGRVSAFGTNPNLIGDLLVLGLLGILGLAYGQVKVNRRARLFLLLFSAALFIAIIGTGSRGAVLALCVGCAVFLFHRVSLYRRVKLWALVALAFAVIVIASLSNESLHERWERSLVQGDTAGRDEIFAQAKEMFLERPLFGWGPVYHQVQLGWRVHYFTARDFHNLFTHLLTEVGIIGSVPFFLGLLMCFISAWKARKTIHGIVPLAMLISILVIAISATALTERMFWLVLSYTAASATPLARRTAPGVETATLQRAYVRTSR